MPPRITELLKNKQKFTFSLEITPEITEEELNSLKIEPLFFSITWHAQSHQCKNLEIAPIKLAKQLRSKGKHVLLHLSCNMMTKEYASDLLKSLQEVDICNLFVVLGEKFDPASADFKSSREFITYIRQETGNYFCIGIAGFPGCNDKLLALKEKMISGADFILTQAVVEFEIFKSFFMKCEDIEITTPIVPGIFPFETESELNSFVNMCKVHISDDLANVIKKETGLSLIIKMIKNIVTETQINHFHFFTMNKMSYILNIIEKMREIPECK